MKKLYPRKVTEEAEESDVNSLPSNTKGSPKKVKWYYSGDLIMKYAMYLFNGKLWWAEKDS